MTYNVSSGTVSPTDSLGLLLTAAAWDSKILFSAGGTPVSDSKNIEVPVWFTGSWISHVVEVEQSVMRDLILGTSHTSVGMH